MSRIAFAFVMVLTNPFSPLFWLCYLCGGFSDMLDGFVARRLKQQSEAGARLDSIADTAFAAAIFIVVIKSTNLPAGLWVYAFATAILRMASYCIGFYKYHTFVSLHTYMNKTAGLLIFLFPLLYVAVGLLIAALTVGGIAFLSAAEELIIIIKSKELCRDTKSIFAKQL